MPEEPSPVDGEERFSIDLVAIAEGIGQLVWADAPGEAALQQALSFAADDALLGQGLRRLECEVDADDPVSRRALHRAGFRLEGVRREGLDLGGGRYADLALYARLATDVVHGPEGFSAVMTTVLPTKRVIAHVVFTDELGRMLLLQTTYKRDLELPGGVVEPLEPPRDGAAREVAEEIALMVTLPASPALVDWMPPLLGWADAIEFIYDGGVLDASMREAMRLDAREIVAAHWLQADELDGAVSELSARRLRAILAARGTGRVLFTENGAAVGA